jgi:hypothetical protein
LKEGGSLRHISQKMIEAFISDELNENELRQVLEHIEECPSCYDEIEVYYMITVGLLKQDHETRTGNADLQTEFKDFIEEKKRELNKEVNKKDRKSYFMTALVMASLILLYYLGSAFLSPDRDTSQGTIFHQTGRKLLEDVHGPSWKTPAQISPTESETETGSETDTDTDTETETASESEAASAEQREMK